MELLLLELGLIIAVSWLLGYIVKLIGQPAILGYIVAGFLGTFLLLDHGTGETLELFAHLGVALLLFMVGLELKLTEVREVGPVALVTGVGQVVITGLIGGGIANLFFGFSVIEASYIGAALAFSSTIIILKLLGEKGDLNSLYGRILVGFLIVQDIVAIIALIMLNSLGSTEGGTVLKVLEVLATGIVLVFTAIIVGRIIGYILSFAGKASELVLLGAIAWALLFSAYANALGLTIEVGAFLAGIGLAASPLSVEVAAKIKPLRDFFIILFFVNLGLGLTTDGIVQNVPLIALFSVFVLLGNPLILLVLMGSMGYHRRVGFLSGLTVSQISEFSLILIATGVSLGQIRGDLVPIMTGVAIITMVGSSYLINRGDELYRLFAKPLRMFQKSHLNEPNLKNEHHPVVIVFGAHRMGEQVVQTLRYHDIPFVAIDYDPAVLRRLHDLDLPVVYGDLSDPELIEQFDLSELRAVVSTVPSLEDNLLLISQLQNFPGQFEIIVRAKNHNHAEELQAVGANATIVPEEVAGERVVGLLFEHEIVENPTKAT